MLPKCQVVFHYIAEKGDIISDKLDVEFGTELINQLSLKLSTEVASPGGDLDVTIDTKPGSFVGLLGVDQSVLLLKKGNDIESSTVFEELKKFSEVTKYNYCHYSDSNAGDFADMVLITNAKMASGKLLPRPSFENFVWEIPLPLGIIVEIKNLIFLES